MSNGFIGSRIEDDETTKHIETLDNLLTHLSTAQCNKSRDHETSRKTPFVTISKAEATSQIDSKPDCIPENKHRLSPVMTWGSKRVLKKTKSFPTDTPSLKSVSNGTGELRGSAWTLQFLPENNTAKIVYQNQSPVFPVHRSVHNRPEITEVVRLKENSEIIVLSDQTQETLLKVNKANSETEISLALPCVTACHTCDNNINPQRYDLSGYSTPNTSPSSPTPSTRSNGDPVRCNGDHMLPPVSNGTRPPCPLPPARTLPTPRMLPTPPPHTSPILEPESSRLFVSKITAVNGFDSKLASKHINHSPKSSKTASKPTSPVTSQVGSTTSLVTSQVGSTTSSQNSVPVSNLKLPEKPKDTALETSESAQDDSSLNTSFRSPSSVSESSQADQYPAESSESETASKKSLSESEKIAKLNPILKNKFLKRADSAETSSAAAEDTAAGAKPSSGSTDNARKWKRAGLGIKTSIKFKDAGRLAHLKKMYNKMKKDSMSYINALAKDNVFEDEDPFILQHFNEKAKSKKADPTKVNQEEQVFIIDPAGDLFFFTQGLVTIAMLYNLLCCILRICFQEVEEDDKILIFMLDSICDIIYLIDFLVHFRTGYLDDGILVTDTGKIKAHYMTSSTFTMDLVSVIPLCLSYGVTMEFYQHFIYFFTSRPNVEASLIKNLLIGEASLRIAKLAKFYSMRRFFESFGSRTNSPGLMRALCLIIYLVLSIHWVGCSYYYISECEGFGTNDWVFPKVEEDHFDNQFYRKYIKCFYWAFLTLTTIGGPEHPETTLEYGVTCVTFLLGIFIFAAVVGNVGDAITSMNESKTTYQKRADAIKLYMQHHGVPDVLQKKVKKWLEYSWMRTQGVDEQSLMDALPERLRARIAIQIHVKTLKKVKIFENCEHGLLCELVLKLRPQIFSPGDYICRIGEIGKEMFIISHGKVECIITTGTGERKTVAVLVAGQSFGEIALLGVEGCSRRTADVRAIGYSELLSLSKKALTQALEDYPEARKQLEAEGKNRLGKGSSKQAPSKYKDDDSDTEPSRDEGISGVKPSELTKLVKDLKEFDSVKYKDTVKKLESQKALLQNELDVKCRELKDARQRIQAITNIYGNKPNGNVNSPDKVS